MKKFLAKCEDQKRVFKVFAVAMYGMVIFLKVPNHMEAVMVDLVEPVDNQANHVSAIIAKTIRLLNFCRKRAKNSLSGV